MDRDGLFEQVRTRWNDDVLAGKGDVSAAIELRCVRHRVPAVCEWLVDECGCCLAGLVVEEQARHWNLFYVLSGPVPLGPVLVSTTGPVEERRFPSVSVPVHAADWHEREAEDLFGLIFEGHPRLGDFVLHDDAWQEGVEPMRSGFDLRATLAERTPQTNWRPRRIVHAPGAFIMPVGPVYSGAAESVHFHLETIGEEVLRATPRLFYKYRGIERAARGRTVDDTLLLGERFAGSTAFSHAVAFSMATEQLCAVQVPARADALRLFLAELERLRHHLGVIADICHSTGLVVAASQVALLEEEALRLSAVLTGHRYLFGLAVPGGLSRDLDTRQVQDAAARAAEILRGLETVQRLLFKTSSFLDRLEEVGVVGQRQAREHGMVGPVARGSAYCNDLRSLHPYGAYEHLDFTPACESEGDGYARLRILFAESRKAVDLMERSASTLPAGPVREPCWTMAGTALAGVETPRGAAWHWLHLKEDGRVLNYRLLTPSFANWHGFHTAAENFAFQDFPIILATFGLSVAENDR